jgi:hypothetical protein
MKSIFQGLPHLRDAGLSYIILARLKTLLAFSFSRNPAFALYCFFWLRLGPSTLKE